MSHGNITSEVGTCPVCRRDHQQLARQEPIRDDMPERLACTDEAACFAAYCLLPQPSRKNWKPA